MGNFFTDDSVGAALGMWLGSGIKQRMDNAAWKKAYTDTQGNLGVTSEDRNQATLQLMKDRGLDRMAGTSPLSGVMQIKKDYGKYQKAYDQAVAANDVEGQKHYQTLMDVAHNDAELYRKVASYVGLDTSGYGADVSLDNLKNATDNTAAQDHLVDSIGQGLPYTSSSPVRTTLSDLARKHTMPEPGKTTLSELAGRVPAQYKVNYDWNNPPTSLVPKPRLTYGLKEEEKTITLDDLKAYFGEENGVEVDRLTRQLARERMLNPDAIDQLEYQLRNKGYSGSIIEDMLNRAGSRIESVRQEQVIDNVKAKLDSGDYNGAYVEGLKAVSKNPQIAQSIFSGMPTPKEGWNRENAVDDRNFGFRAQDHFSNKQYAQQNKLADKQFDQSLQQMAAQYGYNINLKMFDVGAKKELYNFMAKLGIGPNGRSNSNGVSPQYKAALDYVKLVQGQNKDSLDDKWKDDPQYKTALAVVAQGYGGAQGESGTGASGGKQYDRDNYYDSIQEAGEIISAIRSDPKRKNMPIESIVSKFRELYGDMADQIINDVDWSAWGYNYKPHKQIGDY